MFIGFYSLNATAFGLVTAENASGIAVAADALPTFRVYGASETPVSTGTCTAFDAGNLTGVYKFSFTVTGGFSRGSNYQIVVSYDVSSQPRERTFSVAIT